MKNVLLLLTFFLIFSCKEEVKIEAANTDVQGMSATAPEQLGKEIFEGKGNCSACHQPNTKVIGPSISDIAKKYKEQNGNLIAFLKEESAPIVDPSQYEVMRTNFAITKTFSEEELKAVEAYFYSHLK
ncbi:c-type cytochrome [Flavobacterium sp. GT3R68]|uniref:c-type cytochrome n=1 Tax=Flavobacterium sp. GT3R68 TaxID=2594437 RepID=UPI000F896ECD|nr:c-type cytochrome [Flavobacterium sp. GT3R68]RTY95978.1 c-type cytochrome [Flavobacterium sp. GSN2]TRW93751.1 c-type cytochrome [Flavobacterium sp. GT3R68]